MDSENLMVTQAAAVKAANPKTRVFVYRNLVKALPWFPSVRAKLEDPAFAGWFLKYKDGINGTGYTSPACTAGKCSALFHDKDQTPQHDPHADGSCTDPCDCGENLPCGEYIWDHRNSSLREFLIKEYAVGGTALGNPDIDGLFLDDDWQDTAQPNPGWGPPEGFCTHDTHGGPSETYPNCTVDMGLTASDVADITAAWKDTVAAVHVAALAAKRWIFQLFTVVGGAPQDAKGCKAYFRASCLPNATALTSAMLFSFSSPKSSPLPSPTQDLATFLLTRGPFAWIGYQWVGCVFCSPEIHVPPAPKGLCDPAAATTGVYERPPGLDVDYGTPVDATCSEVGSSGVFKRAWTKADVSIDCSSFTAKITPK